MIALPILLASAIFGLGHGHASDSIVAPHVRTDRTEAPVPAYLPAPFYLPGRAEDARVAGIAWRLATAGRARCPWLDPASGMVLQHLSQFQLADRAGILADLPLDRGAGVIVVVPDGPAARAGIRPGDVLVAIDGTALPPEPGRDSPFDAARAHARVDLLADLLRTARTVTLLRDGATHDATLAPLPACPSLIHLARSPQRNAFADGRHVFVTTGVLGELRSDDELGFLIAHEMAHNILGHAAIMRSGVVRGRGEVRRIEQAADLLGGDLMLDAGLDPVAGAQWLMRIDGGAFGIALFAKHEPPAKRIAALRTLATARAVR